MLFTEAHQYKKVARRIVCLVPSITELLFDLHLETEVIGITKFCIHPTQWFRNKIRVGGTKNIDIQKVESLKADLVICSKEENVKEQVDLLKIKFEVLLTDVSTLEDALQMIRTIGTTCDRNDGAEKMVTTIEGAFADMPVSNRLKTVYLIWKDPLMTVGGDTFINDMMARAGFENVFAGSTRYPEINIDQIKFRQPELVLLSSEPYPFKQKHIEWLQDEIPGTRIILADGEMFGCYGNRLLEAPAYFETVRKACNY